MSQPNRTRSRKVRSTLDHVTRLSDEAQHNALRAEDVLNALEDREGRRAVRSSVANPRDLIR